jgi:hypothetical protein
LTYYIRPNERKIETSSLFLNLNANFQLAGHFTYRLQTVFEFFAGTAASSVPNTAWLHLSLNSVDLTQTYFPYTATLGAVGGGASAIFTVMLALSSVLSFFQRRCCIKRGGQPLQGEGEQGGSAEGGNDVSTVALATDDSISLELSASAAGVRNL